MSRTISAALIIVGLVFMTVGTGISMQKDLIEERYQQLGEPGPSYRTITVYPDAPFGTGIIWIGAVIEILATIASALSGTKEETPET